MPGMLASLPDSQDCRVDTPEPPNLLARVAELPAAAPLLQRLSAQPDVHLVGGATRDLLLGGHPNDLDLVVEGDPAEIAARLGGEVRAHDRFGTSTVSVGDFSYDIARARRETYAHPGALPDVEPAPLAEDLLRRDFTVNAIAIALTGPEAGTLNAVPRALEDLEDRRLRVLHDASFIDDPTRMLRLARYAARLGFTIDPHTAALLHPEDLGTVTGSRVGTELRLLAREPDPVVALLTLHRLGLDRAIHPEFGLEDEALAQRALALLPPDARRDRLVVAAAGARLPAAELTRLLDQLAFEAADRAAIVAAASRAGALARLLSAAGAPSEIARAARGAGPELVALAGALGPAEPARRWLNELRHVRLQIDGSDLIQAGLPEGPAIGRGLAAALAAKLDGRATDKAAELAAALETVRRTE
jgi:tRNA nucleotidyltransferase (CCA-adding enzyme)